ncbi:MAG: TetR/AcrR family transcriptional regulator [Eubacterium sp.]
MSRNKHPEVTINRILDVAFNLFSKKGYEQTTIQNIVDELGDLSKGAIYHHFKSKEEIIDRLLYRINSNPIAFEGISENFNTLNGIEKIRTVLIASLKNEQSLAMYRAAPNLLKNPKFLSLQLTVTMENIAPEIQVYIEEGICDGSIQSDSPKLLAEFFSLIANIWINPGVFPLTKSEFIDKVLFAKKTFDALGLPVVNDKVLQALHNFANELNL